MPVVASYTFVAGTFANASTIVTCFSMTSFKSPACAVTFIVCVPKGSDGSAIHRGFEPFDDILCLSIPSVAAEISNFTS